MLVPVNLDMSGAAVLCIGGGPVAAAKVIPLVEAGAVLTVISPAVQAELAQAADVHEARRYRHGDLHRDPRPMLVVAATADAGIDQQVADEAEEVGIWCLRIDGRGTVALPSVVRRGGLVLAMSTGAPSLSRALRVHLDAVLGDSWGSAADVLSSLRASADVRSALARVPADTRRERWRAATAEALEGADRTRLRAVLVGDA